MARVLKAKILPIKQIRVEREDYFKHPFTTFKTPVELSAPISRKKFGRLYNQFQPAQPQTIPKSLKEPAIRMLLEPSETRSTPIN